MYLQKKNTPHHHLHYIVSYIFCIEISIVYLHIHLYNDRKTMYLYKKKYPPSSSPQSDELGSNQ